RSDTGEACEFQLQPQSRVLGSRAGRAGRGMRADVAPGAKAHAPAAGTILEAEESLQRLVVRQRVHPAREDAPGVPDRPRGGGLHLLDIAAGGHRAAADRRRARLTVRDGSERGFLVDAALEPIAQIDDPVGGWTVLHLDPGTLRLRRLRV